jgi:hypothetical protein
VQKAGKKKNRKAILDFLIIVPLCIVKKKQYPSGITDKVVIISKVYHHSSVPAGN